MKLGRMSSALLLGFGMIFALTWGLQAVSARSAVATTRYVSNTSPTCGGRAPCYATIQAAVNAAADGDEIRVAAGTYSGVAPVVVATNTYTQVVAITKTLTLAGGYTNANWTTPDPAANVTTIDAGRNGRGVSIIGTGTQAVTITGFTITGGDYTGMGNPAGVGNQVCARTGGDCGGGLFAYRVRLFVSRCVITDNISSRNATYSDGGGAYFWSLLAGSRIENTDFISNTTVPSLGAGGGARVTFGSGIAFRGCRFQDNSSGDEGGGLQLFQPSGETVIQDTTFARNKVTGSEGGGGIAARGVPSFRLDRVTLRENQAYTYGAAMYVLAQWRSTVTLTNVLMFGNSLRTKIAADTGSVLELGSAGTGPGTGLDFHAAHLTVANNQTSAILRVEAPMDSPVTATLTNTLIVSASKAFVGAEMSTGEVTIRHTKTMRQYVPAVHAIEAGTPTFQENSPVTGNPMLDATYHLMKGSDAINAGVDAGVTRDIDYNRRPIGSAPDIGADEYGLFRYLPVLMGQ